VLRSTGAYPARDQISAWAGLTPAAVPTASSKASLPMADGCCGGSGCC
jgi:Arsenical resistance operon protein ArsD